MYCITKEESETGKKFAKIEERRILTLRAQKEMAKKFGFKKWRSNGFDVWGGISRVIFENTPDLKVWKEFRGLKEYSPRANTREGKSILKEFKSLPTVSRHDLNMCIGFDEMFSHIGFAVCVEKGIFGFICDEDLKIPEDCEEVLTSTYNELFRGEKKEVDNE